MGFSHRLIVHDIAAPDAGNFEIRLFLNCYRVLPLWEFSY